MTGHDTGAALCIGGKVVAIAEERLNRVKHSFNVFPRLAIEYCLSATNLRPSDIDLVVIDRVGRQTDHVLKKTFTRETNNRFANVRVITINHHDAHAASAFFASPFMDAAVLVYDGAGERTLSHHGVYTTETETLYRGVRNRLDVVQKTTHARAGNLFPYTFGIGKVYSFLSNEYLGFGPYNQGKMMGLAPYGDMSLLKDLPEDRWFKEVNGHIVCNAQIKAPHPEGKTVMATALNLGANLMQRARARMGELLSRGLHRRPKLFTPIELPRPARRTEDVLPDQYYASIARAGQHLMERVAILWGSRLRHYVESSNLCVAGGLGLNIDANRNFIDIVGFKNLFVQPAASDTGVPLGCALWGRYMVLGEERDFVMEHAYLGRRYDEEQVSLALEKQESRIDYKKCDDVAPAAASLLAGGAIIAWFQGESEYGPRALGHRSIIADARRGDAKDVLNRRVKHRETWRPFGCSIIKDRLHEYFDLAVDSPFMLLAGNAQPGIRERIPSVIHVDNTSRIQTVTKALNGRFFELISEFDKLTGVPVVLNTSFNVAGDPMVETPEDALDTFLRTDIDYLVIENVLIRKR